MRVWVSLCKYILICICVPRFPNCFVVMRGQTLVRGTQIYSYQCHIFADNNCHYCDYLSLYKSHYWFKITWKYFPKWYNKGYHWLFKGSCYLTFHFYQEGDWLWDISPTLTTTLGSTGSFQFWLGYSVKFFVYLFVCRLHYFLQKYNNLFENIVLDLWRILSWGVQMHKIVFTTGTLQRRVVFWGIFFQFLRIVSLPILLSCYVFLCFSISWKPFNYFTSVCFTDVLGITLRIILGVWYSVLESSSTLSYEILYICYLYYYGPYFRYSPQCLEKLERFF